MKTSVDCHEAKQLIPAYSIGATDPHETRLVEQALTQCPEVMAELSEYLSVATALQSVVSPSRPAPAGLPRSLIARLNDPLPEPKPVEPSTDESPPPNITPLRQPRWLLLATVAAAVIILVITNAYWFTQVNSLRDQQTRLEAQLLTPSAPTLTNISLQAVHHRQLVPQENASDAQATVLWNSENRIGSLYVTNLPRLPEGQVYQFWLVRDGHSLSLGTFDVDDNGVGTLIFESGENIEDFSAMGVSPEPASGSSEPTAPHVVIGEI